jgi:hypothetical protein
MTKKIILVVASDFQAICAFEYLKRNNYDSCVVLPLDERVDIDVISRLYAIKYRLISLVSFVFYLSKRNIFIFGNDRGYFFKVLRSINILKQIVVVNDGTSDIIDVTDQAKYHYNYLKRVLLQTAMFYGKSKLKTRTNYFTFNKKNSYEFHEYNNFIYAKKFLEVKQTNINYSFSGDFYIGQPLSELNITELHTELNFIAQTFKNRSIDYYVSHPKDSKKKLSMLDKEKNIKVIHVGCFEIALLKQKLNIFNLFSLNSTVVISYGLLTGEFDRIKILKFDGHINESLYSGEFISSNKAIRDFINLRK